MEADRRLTASIELHSVELVQQVAAFGDRLTALLDDHRQRAGGVHQLDWEVHRERRDRQPAAVALPARNIRLRASAAALSGAMTLSSAIAPALAGGSVSVVNI